MNQLNVSFSAVLQITEYNEYFRLNEYTSSTDIGTHKGIIKGSQTKVQCDDLLMFFI